MLCSVDIAGWGAEWSINEYLQGLLEAGLLTNLFRSRFSIIMNHDLETRVCGIVSFIGAQ